MANEILGKKTTRQGFIDAPWVSGMATPSPPQIPDVDRNSVTEWQTSTLSLMERVFGKEAATFRSFESTLNSHKKYDRQTSNNNFVTMFENEIAIFKSAKSEFDGGYLFDVRNLVHADVFTDELEQATYFQGGGWKIPALVIAGTVLESTLRELCNQNGIILSAKATINPMNDELAKAGVYNKAMKTQILNWGQNRNSAAHGNKSEIDVLTDDDVKRMIDGIREFVSKHMS